MSQIVQLCYLITISIAISALSMQLLAKGKNLAATNPLIKSSVMTFFLALVLIFNSCDFLILFLGETIGAKAVDWILVVENVLEVCMAYVLIEMEREHFQLPEKKSRFIFFTAVAGMVLWIDAAYTAGIMNADAKLYMVLMVILNLLPIGAILVFTLGNLRKIHHPGHLTFMEGYFLFYNLIFFFLCAVTTVWIIDVKTAADGVVDNVKFYAVCWLVFNMMNFILIWYSCQTMGEGSGSSSEGGISVEEKILLAKREYGLSDRELEIARLLCKGKNNNDIASDLFVSPNTVKVHTSNLYRKLGVKNRVQAVQVLRGESIEAEE